MATGQQLTGLALGLREQGHEVTVITSDRGYDDPSVKFPRREKWRGIDIIRIPSLPLGKRARWRRALNFLSFLLCCSFRLLLLPRFDRVVALTSPPLISFLGALFVRLKGGKFFFWVMDLNPDEAIAAGWLRQNSFTARLLERFLRYGLRHAERIIVLDRFMKQRIEAKGVLSAKVAVLSPWALDDAVAFDKQGREAFRAKHHLSERFVVMYSGNHSPCHPLDTLLEAARRLAPRRDIDFYFVGGGSEQGKVAAFATANRLDNVRCLPYQAIDELSGSLSAADLHAVVMGKEFVGIVHPCKVYNILGIGAPLLYIGPVESSVTDAAARVAQEGLIYQAQHGESEKVAAHIASAVALKTASSSNSVAMRAQNGRNGNEHGVRANEWFSKSVLLPRMIDLLR